MVPSNTRYCIDKAGWYEVVYWLKFFSFFFFFPDFSLFVLHGFVLIRPRDDVSFPQIHWECDMGVKSLSNPYQMMLQNYCRWNMCEWVCLPWQNKVPLSHNGCRVIYCAILFIETVRIHGTKKAIHWLPTPVLFLLIASNAVCISLVLDIPVSFLGPGHSWLIPWFWTFLAHSLVLDIPGSFLGPGHSWLIPWSWTFLAHSLVTDISGSCLGPGHSWLIPWSWTSLAHSLVTDISGSCLGPGHSWLIPWLQTFLVHALVLDIPGSLVVSQ